MLNDPCRKYSFSFHNFTPSLELSKTHRDSIKSRLLLGMIYRQCLPDIELFHFFFVITHIQGV